MKIDFGVRLPNSGPLASLGAMTQVAQEAEALGYDSAWVHDHIAWTREIHKTHVSSGSSDALNESQEPTFYESITTLGYLAAKVEKIRLGVACLVLPLRNPIYAAKQLANLDILLKGRLDVGIGIGSPATLGSREYEIFGVETKGRGKRADEYIEAIKTIWTTDVSSYQGTYVSFNDAEIYPKPLQKPHPPIWVGGWTKPAAKRTALHGDIWLPAWLTPTESREGFGEVQLMAKKAGRDDSKLQLGAEVYVSVSRDPGEARRTAADTLGGSRGTFERELTYEGLQERSLIGSVEEVRKQAEAYVDAGVTHFETKFIYSSIPSYLEMMKLFRDEIASSFI